jgi:hypothetical protein
MNRFEAAVATAAVVVILLSFGFLLVEHPPIAFGLILTAAFAVIVGFIYQTFRGKL